MRVKVKICGIRTLEVAEAAFDSGADYIGFNFVSSSKRRISIEKAKEIAGIMRKRVRIVGVFQNASVSKVNDIVKEVGLDLVQLHGQEDNTYIAKIKRPVIKSFTLSDNPEDIRAKYLMLDRVVQGQGDMVNVEKAARFAKNLSLFLAGGLTPGNVSDVVIRVRPYAVDVAGGIETNGKQDLEKIKLFIERVKA